jgi:leader peptidase (prepilin peptidase) / N-methyltransferase
MLFALPLWFLLASLTILGVIWGSFVAALCSRWPNGESVAKGRSRCDQCGAQIAARDLIPVASYLLLKGKCRYCGQNIGLLPFATELAAALIGAVPALLLPESQAVAGALFGWLLLPLILLDHQHLWLPNRLVLLLAATGFAVGPMLTPDIAFLDRIVGLFAGFLSLEIVRQVYKQFWQRDGMGAGDPKLFAALGIWLGWQVLPIVLLGGSAIGLLSVSILHLRAKLHRTAFPFGSYLGVAAYVAVVIG